MAFLDVDSENNLLNEHGSRLTAARRFVYNTRYPSITISGTRQFDRQHRDYILSFVAFFGIPRSTIFIALGVSGIEGIPGGGKPPLVTKSCACE